MSRVVLFLGLSFSALAALSAFLIEFEEQRRQYQGWRAPLTSSLGTGLIALVTFAALSIVLAWVLPQVTVR